MEQYIQVMIVDDDRSSTFENTRIIKESGITNCVKTALNGGHALLYLNQIYTNLKEKKLLILLDTKMPIMDGLEFLKHFNRCEYPYKENISIALLIDDNSSKDHVDEARKLGVKSFIRKPLTTGSLQKVLGLNVNLQQVA